MDTENVFELIDRILPFEACLYHQILPLRLQGNRLYLGMVMLDDVAALGYARRLVGYMNYSLVPQSLSSETHYTTLSTYLARKQDAQPKSAPKKTDLHFKETLVVDSPDQLEWQEVQALRAQFAKPESKTLPEVAQEAMPGSALPVLEIHATHQDQAIETLRTLPSAQLLQELFARTLGDGIGRLYFEHQSTRGRVLWSQNGVLQSAIEDLPLSSFTGLIAELKTLTHLPPEPVQQIKQVEIERLCQKQRILLRLRIMPTDRGEEATLQVLRGAALKFYQRQQLTSLSRDALGIARKLQDKMGELQERTRETLAAPLDQIQPEVVPALDQVLQIVEQQLTDLRQIRDSQQN